jgi:UDP-N-acetylglucosamine acyltransferase
VIHQSAIVDRRAELAPDVEVGPFGVVGPGVRIGAGSRLAAHAVVEGPAVIGEGNVIHSFAVVGGAPQRKGSADAAPGLAQARGGPPGLLIGDRNVIREHVTIQRGTEGRSTLIGSDNLFMVGAHVGHDVTIGSRCAFANGVQLAGHVRVEDYANFGGLSGVAQFVEIGQSAFVAAGAMCERNVPPFVIVQGDRARVRALNVVGLRRRGVPQESIAELARVFRRLFVRGGTREEALARLTSNDPYVRALLEALRSKPQRATMPR